MADNLLFRKGTYAQLQNAEKVIGAIDFTTDEPAIYLNVETEDGVERKRVGDIIQFNTLNEFKAYAEQHTGNLPKTALYYIIDTNSLLKWVDGTKTEDERWQQINVSYSEEIGALQGEVSGLNQDVEDINSRLAIIDELLGNSSGEEGGSTGAIVDRIDAVEEAVENLSDRLGPIEELKLKDTISGLQGNIVDKADKSDLEELQSELENDLNTLQGNLDAKEQKITKNAQDISNINTAIQGINKDIVGLTSDLEALQGSVSTNTNNIAANLKSINDNKTAIEAALVAAKKELNDSINTVSGKANELETQIGDINGIIEELQGDIVDFNSELVDLSNDLHETITNEINAANAMNFIGSIKASDNQAHASFPTNTKFKAGDTYVATNTIKGINGVDFENGYTAYAGDLIIASGIEGEDGYIIAEGLTWNIVNTGYQEAHDQRLELDDTTINLISDTSNSSSSVNLEGDSNSNIVVERTIDAEGKLTNTLSFKMVWQSFESVLGQTD